VPLTGSAWVIEGVSDPGETLGDLVGVTCRSLCKPGQRERAAQPLEFDVETVTEGQVVMNGYLIDEAPFPHI
jgi:hypothetical protein